MIYYKTSQIVPGKGDAWMYYECNDDESVRRYMTYIPVTGELDKVPKPYIKKLQRPEMLQPCTPEEFFRHWPEDGSDSAPTSQETVSNHLKEKGVVARQHFDADMTVVSAMNVHPKVPEVFAAFHLGGCSSCGISEIETVGQVCMAYGVDVDLLLDILEELMTTEEEESSEPIASQSSNES